LDEEAAAGMVFVAAPATFPYVIKALIAATCHGTEW